MSAEQDFEALMEEAMGAAWRSSHSFTSKLQTSVRFTARKTLKKSPQLAVRFLVGKIPLAGGAIAFATGKIFDKIRKKRVAAGVFKAEGEEVLAAASAKWIAKSISDMGTKIDGNITKQVAAVDALNTALTKLDAVNKADSTAADWISAFKNAAYAYYRVDHYNYKLAELVEACQAHLGKIETSIESAEDTLLAGKDRLQVGFIEKYEQMFDDQAPLAGFGRGRSSSS